GAGEKVLSLISRGRGANSPASTQRVYREPTLRLPLLQRRVSMLVRLGNDRPFPTNDLSFVTFVTTAYRNLIRLQQSFEPTERSLLRRETHGFLQKVPILSHLSLPVQVDLLAQTWARHYSRRVLRASLLDGAVIFAACREAADAFAGDPSLTLMIKK